MWWAAATLWGMIRTPGMVFQLLKLHMGWAFTNSPCGKEVRMAIWGRSVLGE